MPLYLSLRTRAEIIADETHRCSTSARAHRRSRSQTCKASSSLSSLSSSRVAHPCQGPRTAQAPRPAQAHQRHLLPLPRLAAAPRSLALAPCRVLVSQHGSSKAAPRLSRNLRCSSSTRLPSQPAKAAARPCRAPLRPHPTAHSHPRTVTQRTRTTAKSSMAYTRKPPVTPRACRTSPEHTDC